LGAAFLRVLIGVAAGALFAKECAAHEAASGVGAHSLFDALLAILLLGSGVLYARGVSRLWRKAGAGRGVRGADVARFALGWATLAVALLSPLETVTSRSFAMHMVQHELLMVVAAPMLVLARPLEAWTWALPARADRALAVFAHTRFVRSAWRRWTAPVGAWCVHALALWIWHLPALFVAALESQALHVLQHACFFASALAFWWAVLPRGARAPGPVSVACLFTTMLHTAILGALLTFAPAAWYGGVTQSPPWGLSPLEDQQLGGLVMWVPGGVAYVVATLVIVGRWLAPVRSERGVA
jgi:putative membrane protein